jgi:hypothetical protein
MGFSLAMGGCFSILENTCIGNKGCSQGQLCRIGKEKNKPAGILMSGHQVFPTLGVITKLGR